MNKVNKLQKEWKEKTFEEYRIAKLTGTLTKEHKKMVLAILDGGNMFLLESCGFVSLFVAKKYNLIYM